MNKAKTLSVNAIISKVNGVFAVNKPTGQSSAAIVQTVKNELIRAIVNHSREGETITKNKKLFNKIQRSVKVGHGGTLDPLATGVLVIGVGSGCKQLGSIFLKDSRKGYKATVRLGEFYDTLDRTGTLLELIEDYQITEDQVKKVISDQFVGEIKQKPPAFSAIHINGRRAYDIARETTSSANSSSNSSSNDAIKQMEQDMPERSITIYECKLSNWSPPSFTLDVVCSSGTYIRSLIRDIGFSCQLPMTMYELQRTMQGSFLLANCVTCDQLQSMDLDDIISLFQ